MPTQNTFQQKYAIYFILTVTLLYASSKTDIHNSLLTRNKITTPIAYQLEFTSSN